MITEPSRRTSDAPTAPSDISSERSRFDDVAEVMIRFASRGRFLLIVAAAFSIWLAAGYVGGFEAIWLNAGATGIAWITLLLVFAVENAQRRSDQAVQRKLNAMADALADFMEAADVPDRHSEELRAAVGLEKRESAD